MAEAQRGQGVLLKVSKAVRKRTGNCVAEFASNASS